ncbi:O-antigen ligase family protein [Shewanella sp. KX20019]|uniref:O-antigen ligase family protein n=1 Tax=Shewanella sp. KX20019 TaxID=2803864 RepID=UPI001928CEA2|nr:O-antigen ligase family protein [Shewanella sp. KX20019]QQX80634.1 O-antigen ligase family protein [Shewanella sp. KX20019]
MLLKTYAWGVVATFAILFLLGTVFSFNLIPIVSIDNGYDFKRLIVVGFIAISSLGLLAVRGVELVKVSTLTKILFSGFTCLAAYSALASKHPYWGMVEIANIGLLVVAFYVLSACMRAIEQDKLHCGVYAFSLLFSVLTFCKYILFLLFSYFDAQSFNIHGLLSGYVNVRFFNQLQVMLVPLLFLPFFCQGLTKFGRVSIVVIALHWTVLLQTEARGGILSLILALSVMLYFLSPDTRKKMVFTMLKSMLIGMSLWLVFIILIPYWLMEGSNFQIRTGSSGRIDLWLYVLKSIPEQPWLGFGPMSFTWAEGRPLPNAHPHNSVMQLLYEYGVVACIAVTAWVLSCVYRCLAGIQEAINDHSVPVTYAVLAGLIYSLISGVLVMPMAQFLLVFLLAIQVQFCTNSLRKIGLEGRVLLFAALTIIIYLLLSSYQNEELLPALFPRLWLNGLIGD